MPKKQVVLETEYLSNVYMGIYTRTIYYSDGTFETQLIPKGPIIIFPAVYPDVL